MLRSCSISGRDLKVLSTLLVLVLRQLCFFAIFLSDLLQILRIPAAISFTVPSIIVSKTEHHLQSNFLGFFFFAFASKAKKKNEEISVKVLRLNSLRRSRTYRFLNPSNVRWAFPSLLYRNASSREVICAQ